MAQPKGKKKIGAAGNGSNKKRTVKSSKNYTKTTTKEDYKLKQEIKLVLVFALSVFLFVCNFGVVGKVGGFLSSLQFGLFGCLAYIAPLALGFVIIFMIVNEGFPGATRKTVFGVLLFLLLSMLIDIINGISVKADSFGIEEFWLYGVNDHRGGGFISASLDYALLYCISKVGTILLIVALSFVCIIIITEKSLVEGIKNTRDRAIEKSDAEKGIKAEVNEERRIEQEERNRKREEERRIRQAEREARNEEARKKKEEDHEAREDEKVLRVNKRVRGVTEDTRIEPEKKTPAAVSGDMHEINLNGFDPLDDDLNTEDNTISTHENEAGGELVEIYEEEIPTETPEDTPAFTNVKQNEIHEITPRQSDEPVMPGPASKPVARPAAPVSSDSVNNNGVYSFPPIDLLTKGNKNQSRDSAQEIRDTARKLQETLAVFGVEATVTDISQGPTVTRFELKPELGVKVSRIKNLSDDIKLSLAAADIRIEAPIPGKAAIGIEVPNKVNQAVLFRDLIDNADFKNFGSDLAFAVGKDIAGKNIIYDIDKFPHLLIAGQTGSGKSVCINTLIMSILYKANPNDVKLIMIDPKVVELSVYNGIPHLLTPVVTDAKKAAGTLNYAVNEMMERYKKFADMNTRDLAGYNRAIEEKGESELYKKLPQIIIIVDELADLVMVAKNDVEEAVCRLAQLARAAGIHLIIATQRPSVDVITGLIKANMPSRIAFSVASNIDSRTILDMGGAEELLGKGDMLFFPKGLKKPVRLQGGYVSDEEVNSVVDYLRNKNSSQYDATVEQKISTIAVSSGTGVSQGDGGDGTDELFIEAGKFIIDKNKASIGLLQRQFKMGFNRAARIMDQLCEAGVVGPDEGTKPRQILMDQIQFENYIENEM